MKLIKDPQSTTNVYLRVGCKDRDAYLRHLSEDFGLPLSKVKTVANLLGPDEDFDALLSTLDHLSLSAEYL